MNLYRVLARNASPLTHNHQSTMFPTESSDASMPGTLLHSPGTGSGHRRVGLGRSTGRCTDLLSGAPLVRCGKQCTWEVVILGAVFLGSSVPLEHGRAGPTDPSGVVLFDMKSLERTSWDGKFKLHHSRNPTSLPTRTVAKTAAIDRGL